MIDEKNPVVLNTLQSGEKTLSEASRAYIIDNNALNVNEEKTYNVRVWLDENVTTEIEGVQNSNWSAKITINAKYSDHLPTDYEKCVANYGEDSINCQIIAQLDTTGVCPTLDYRGNVSINSSESANSYLCSAPDDYGTSYYYRGNVTNNYVLFGEYYWRIIRINGDGSIRLIYDGTSEHNNEESSEDRQIGTSAFNERYDNNTYIGYMYGNADSEGYDETHNNTNSSTIKIYLDDWYKNNIESKNLSGYISDTLFCNDRTLVTGSGVGTIETIYKGYYGPWSDNFLYRTVQLKCNQQNDRFTTDDESIGNGDLTYPIGLITKDESILAGGYNLNNNNFFLFTGNAFWTMTSHSFNATYASMSKIYSSGSADSSDSVNNIGGVRPIINLKPNSLKLGDGTASNPYRVA